MTPIATSPPVPNGGERVALARASALLSVPKAAAADSFILHAPLELAARVGLLPYVAPGCRDAAVGMIDWLADRYQEAGEPLPPPAERRIGTPEEAAARLVAALAGGDTEEVNALAAALLPLLSVGEAAELLGAAVVPSLAAAGHAPIGFALLARVGGLPATLLRGAMQSLSRAPGNDLQWFRGAPGGGRPDGLGASLRSVPRLGRPGSDFILPLMSQVEEAGVCTRLLAPLLADSYDVAGARSTLTRVAAWSMVHDDPTQAPYGWTHALTMPQGVMALAGRGVSPRTALAVAATFAAGFRAAHGTVDLPERIVAGPAPETSVEAVATAAALHEDAHLVKYTLACIHAMQDDPDVANLYLTAAAYLVDWWR